MWQNSRQSLINILLSGGVIIKTVLSQSDVFTSVTAPQKYDASLNYIMSDYTVTLNYKNSVLLFNTLTRGMLALSEDEYLSLDTLKGRELKKRLVSEYYYVAKGTDEHKLCGQFKGIAALLNNYSGINSFTIFPTMDCNARCFYCFQHGSRRYHMSDENARRTADFIIKKSAGKKVSLLWFGGEPLYNTQAIDIICGKLKTYGLEYQSKMISNGYLLDEAVAIHAKNDWNLKSVQITLDGTENIYNRTKAYIYKTEESAFLRVINNIETALSHGIKVDIRLNMGKDNKDDLRALTEYLCDRFEKYKDLLLIYGWLLYDNRGAIKTVKSENERHALTVSLNELQEYIYKRGFGSKAAPTNKIMLNMCGADADNNVTVLPDGSVGKCDHYSDSNKIGTIDSEEFDISKINELKEHRPETALCGHCPLYPQCIKLKCCPELGEYDCDEVEQKSKLTRLYRQMKNAYNKSVDS